MHRHRTVSTVTALVGLCTMIAGCGGGSSTISSTTARNQPASGGLAAACKRIRRDRVAALVRAAGGNPSGLRRSSVGAVQLTHCKFRARGVNADLTLDAGRLAVRGYFNRITEFSQFSSNNPALRPHPVAGVGDRGVPGGGANWVPAFDQLLSVRGRGALIATFYVSGAGKARLKRGAIRLTRIAYAALGAGRNEG